MFLITHVTLPSSVWYLAFWTFYMTRYAQILVPYAFRKSKFKWAITYQLTKASISLGCDCWRQIANGIRPASCRLCGARPEIGQTLGLAGYKRQLIAGSTLQMSGRRTAAVRPVRIGRHPAGYRRGITGTLAEHRTSACRTPADKQAKNSTPQAPSWQRAGHF